MILVTGATGTIGTEVVRILAERGERVRAMTRKPEGANLSAKAAEAAEVVRGDFEDPDSLDAAVAGADAVFLLDAPGPWIERHDLAMLDAVRSHGIGKVVKLSAIGTGENSDLRVGGWHLPGERAVRAGEAVWTILRPSSFASNTLRWAPMIRAGQPVANMTANGAQGVVDPRDIAEVAVAALTTPDHAGKTYTLTGPELLSTPDQVEILRKVLNRPIEIVGVPLEEAKEQMIAAGLDPEFAEVAMRGQRFIAEGRNAELTTDVVTVLGRPARSYEIWADDHRAAFG
ncbi:SDR family NAD(P)-dependent oxidoreductase [Catenulispora sp. NF23]|uniref:SDR family NAD(P)-dependent oxidoreductase n=1 Tax=Catenulispora pinistramenti TaxID=2705254 RepID=A0ABS5KZY6_9ACTN|nr:SDR family NAD(P)-dependent oxidoreductase [Catenulispora pinistramenti]MBS2540200.1 SDR family NAD(P)-dependent oxidoreductase [Catenulispora pinistramenti]MBS2551647.1 SDR family NAD(P)-dependent oxidoreductase [Catenulispora pinistramenti]